jgi:hypothetical protein
MRIAFFWDCPAGNRSLPHRKKRAEARLSIPLPLTVCGPDWQESKPSCRPEKRAEFGVGRPDFRIEALVARRFAFFFNLRALTCSPFMYQRQVESFLKIARAVAGGNRV